MSSVDTGGAAFPIPKLNQDGWNGMTLRDYFAAAAPVRPGGWDGHVARTFGFTTEQDSMARWAYAYADAMIAERAK